MPNRSTRPSASGFTLVELLVVMVILGLLASMVLPNFFGQAAKARVKAARVQISSLSTALDTFALDVGRYPSTQDGLDALTSAPTDAKRWDGPYLPKSVPADPWGNSYQYEGPDGDGFYEITSYGADGKSGGEGDAADISSRD